MFRQPIVTPTCLGKYHLLENTLEYFTTCVCHGDEMFSVPEEIVDNTDLCDPEGMLQLSRVSHLY